MWSKFLKTKNEPTSLDTARLFFELDKIWEKISASKFSFPEFFYQSFVQLSTEKEKLSNLWDDDAPYGIDINFALFEHEAKLTTEQHSKTIAIRNYIEKTYDTKETEEQNLFYFLVYALVLTAEQRQSFFTFSYPYYEETVNFIEKYIPMDFPPIQSNKDLNVIITMTIASYSLHEGFEEIIPKPKLSTESKIEESESSSTSKEAKIENEQE
jgi:hypothetical protein